MSNVKQTNNLSTVTQTSDRFYQAAAGCYLDIESAKKRDLDLPELRRLGEWYRMGWLHNVLSRITPLTMQRMDDYVTMADLFVEDASSASHVLDRFDADLELFCSVADINVTKHMTAQTVSTELKAHVALYNAVAEVFYAKFDIEKRDPIYNLTLAPIMNEQSNPFVKEFMENHFRTAK